MDILVVGAGIAGCSVARLLAEKGLRVAVCERKSEVGGCAYDYRDAAGVLVHKYGPHIFHTREKRVWDFLSRFTGWVHYQHKVLGWIQGQLVPLPINLDTINQLYGTSLDSENVKGFLDGKRVKPSGEPANMREAVIAQIGEELFDLVFNNYTRKQWGRDAAELPASIAARVPARFNRDPRYFTDQYQGMPELGYTVMMQAMLDHPNIKTFLNTDAGELGIREGDAWRGGWKNVVYTGNIEDYFKSRFGPLPYRSLRFELATYDMEFYQPAAVVNYPNDYDFTRITEFKHFGLDKTARTTVMFEYPSAEGEPYYPLPVKSAEELYVMYKAEADKLSNVQFLGRIAQYRYMNMDQVVLSALELAESIAWK